MKLLDEIFIVIDYTIQLHYKKCIDEKDTPSRRQAFVIAVRKSIKKPNNHSVNVGAV